MFKYDQELLRVPVETMKLTLKKAQASVERDLSLAIDQFRAGTLSNGQLQAKIVALKAKTAALKTEHLAAAEIFDKRAEFLETHDAAAPTSQLLQDEVTSHLEVAIVDYLLRNGLYETAQQYASCTGIAFLADLDIMEEASVVVRSLRDHQTDKALVWCAANRSFLKKQASPLEFELRLQKYYDLASKGDIVAAINYSRKTLTKYLPLYGPQLLASSGSLLVSQFSFSDTVDIQKRWQTVTDLFLSSFLLLHGKEPHIALLHRLGAGLGALRTHECYPPFVYPLEPRNPFTEQLRRSCPVCSNELGELALGSSYAHQVRSTLPSDPILLPTNRIYSMAHLKRHAKQIGVWPRVEDPVSSEQFDRSELRTVYPT